MIRCDNPACSSLGEPEWLDPKGKKGHSGPYGWIQASVSFIGLGPSLEVDACSVECFGPAVAALLEQYRREERERYS